MYQTSRNNAAAQQQQVVNHIWKKPNAGLQVYCRCSFL